MKILHLISGGDTGGAKTHLITLLKKLMEYDVEIQVVCVMEGDFTKEAIKNNIPLKVFNQKNRASFKEILEIKNYIKKQKFDLVHCHGARANYIAFIIKNFLKIPFITTLHSDYKLDFQDNFYKKLIFTPINYICLKNFKYILAVTDSFKNMLIKRNFNPKNILTIYNGINFQEKINITPKAQFLNFYNIPFEEDKIYIGMVARLQTVKGVKYFLQAIDDLIKKDKEDKIRVLIAGSGTLKKDTEDFILNNNLQNKVKILGFIKDINSFYNIISINILSSLSESFPYSLLEGARLKKATIATNVGGIPEMIKNNETGFLVEPKDWKGLSEKISFLINNPKILQDFGEKFYNFTYENFSDTKMANLHKEIYKNIITKEF